MAFAPQLVKSWTVTANLRHAYVSLNDMAAWWLYQNKAAMLAAGWTVQMSCDGVTGDATDRWASAANCTTRFNGAAGAQSFCVLRNADGLEVLLAYSGATDDICLIAYSIASHFVLAGTPAQQPTAADQVTLSTGNTIVNATTSADRVMSIWATTESWASCLFRQSALVCYAGVEKIDSYCGAGVFTVPYVAYRYAIVGGLRRIESNATVGGTGVCCAQGATAIGSAGAAGMIARVFTSAATRNIRLAGMVALASVPVGSTTQTIVANSLTFAATPALQNGAIPLVPLYLVGELATVVDGVLGTPIDWFQGLTSSTATPAIGDFCPGYDPGDTPGVTSVRTNWWVVLGSATIRPWRNAGASLEIT